MKIFISHEKHDNEYVKRIEEVLLKYKIEYWVDKKQIYPSISDAKKKIKKGINECTHFLLLYSHNSSESDYVKEEVTNALSKASLIKFSLRLDNTNFENEFKKFADYHYERINANNLKDKLRDFIFQKIAKDCHFVSQIRIFKDKVRFDFEHFSKLDPDNISVKGFKTFDTYNEFVSQRYRLLRNGNEKKNLLKYVTEILRKNSRNFVPVVGNYGSGKSLLSFYVLYHLCEEITKDEIIPIYIPLGELHKFNHSGKSNLVKGITSFIENEYKIAAKEKFCDYLKRGKIILILDALDEMSSKIDQVTIDKDINNIKELVILGNEVVLTSRYTYLTKSQETRFIEDDDLIEILDFDSTNRKDFISKKAKHGKLLIQSNSLIKYLNKPEIAEFISKPLFLQVICISQDLHNLSLLNPAKIIEKLTEEWIIHDVNKDERLNYEEKKKLQKIRQRISESLALHANKSRGNNAISLKDLRKQVKKEFESEIGYQISDQKLHQYYKDAKDSTFLVKEKREGKSDTYSFTYQSIVDYLIARRIVNCINDDSQVNKLESILKYSQEIKSHETYQFIGYITDIEWSIKTHAYQTLNPANIDVVGDRNYLDRSEVLFETVKYAKSLSTKSNSKLNPKIGNLINIIYSVTQFGKFRFRNNNQSSMDLGDLSNCNLDGAKLTNAILPKINLASSNLDGVDLEGSDLNSANLSRANLENGKLKRANLDNIKLEGARLYFTDFTHSSLVKANLKNASLIETKFTGANLEGADFTDVNRNRPKQDWISYDAFYDLDLSLSLFSGASFFNAFMPYAIIINPAGCLDLKGDNNTDIHLAVTDDSNLIDQMSTFTKKVPEIIRTKKEIGEILNAREESPNEITWQRISKLPD